MITNKDIRVENGSLIINGDPYPLDGQSPEAIMQIVEDNSDTTPTHESTNPVTSGGVYSAINDVVEMFGDVVTVDATQGQAATTKCKYIKIGKMVIASGFIAGGVTYMQSGTKVFEGLPAPEYFTEIFAVQSGGNGYKRFALNATGEIYCYSALTETNDISFYLCYVAK